MISCAQRQAARAATIPQLEAAGLTVRVFLDSCDPIGPEDNGPIALKAVTHASGRGGPMLLVEDDIDLAPDFTAFLDMALQAQAAGGDRPPVAYLYLHDRLDRMKLHYGPRVTERILMGKPMPRTLLKPPVPRYLYGTQCVLIPEAFVGAFRAELEREPRPVDRALEAAIHARAWPVLVALPHPVQHRRDFTGRTAKWGEGKVKHSHSFWLPRVEAA